MKKIVYLALCLGALTSLNSCNPKAKATPGQAAKRYTEHIVNDDYNAFVRAIKFTETPANAAQKSANYTRSTVKAVKNDVERESQRELRESRRNWTRDVNREEVREVRTIEHPNVTERVGITQVEGFTEVVDKDRDVEVIVDNTYANSLIDEVRYKMVNDDNDWKIRVTDNKEVWRAQTNRDDKETLKIRDKKVRDFLKDNERGEREFVKELTKRGGKKEIVKTREDGKRHREVVKALNGGEREVEKVKIDGKKLIDLKEIERNGGELLKVKGNGNGDRFREVVR